MSVPNKVQVGDMGVDGRIAVVREGKRGKLLEAQEQPFTKSGVLFEQSR
jgi:hypothetical protein